MCWPPRPSWPRAASSSSASSAAARSRTTARASSWPTRSWRCRDAGCWCGRSSARWRPRWSTTCAAFGVAAGRRDGHPGCWCDGEGAAPRKIGALGLRVERGVSYHGIALNVDPDLADFDLIDPCGMPGVISTSIARELGPSQLGRGSAARRARALDALSTVHGRLDAPSIPRSRPVGSRPCRCPGGHHRDQPAAAARVAARRRCAGRSRIRGPDVTRQHLDAPGASEGPLERTLTHEAPSPSLCPEGHGAMGLAPGAERRTGSSDLRAGARGPPGRRSSRASPRLDEATTTDARGRRLTMAAGLFELRKDAITGWWVATVVDRAFHRDRFALRADPVDDDGKCQNCTEPPGDGVRVRTLKDYAFHVVGTDAEARALDASVVQVALSQAKAAGQLADRRRGAERAPAALRRRHRHDRRAADRLPDSDPRREEGRTDRVRPGRPELGRPGRCANEPLVPRPVRPPADPASDRRGARRGGPLRHPRRRVPVVPARRAKRPRGRTGSSTRTTRAWPSPRTHRGRRSRSGSCPATTTPTSPGRATPRSRRPPIRSGACSRTSPTPRRPAVQPRPPYGAAQGAGRRHVPLALGDPSAPARDRRPGDRNGPSGQPGAAVPLLMVGVLLGWAAAPAWTELVLMWPNRVGGIPATCAEAFRPYNPVLASLTGTCYWWR